MAHFVLVELGSLNDIGSYSMIFSTSLTITFTAVIIIFCKVDLNLSTAATTFLISLHVRVEF